MKGVGFVEQQETALNTKLFAEQMRVRFVKLKDPVQNTKPWGASGRKLFRKRQKNDREYETSGAEDSRGFVKEEISCGFTKRRDDLICADLICGD